MFLTSIGATAGYSICGCMLTFMAFMRAGAYMVCAATMIDNGVATNAYVELEV